MQAAIRSPLAAGVALIGAGTIAATPIAATPPDVHISDLRLTLSTQIMQVSNPIVLGEELVGRTLGDAVRQTTRAASFPIAKAIVLNLARAIEGGVPVTVGTSGTDAASTSSAAIGRVAGGGLLSTIPNLVLDGVATTVRLVPAVIGAGMGVVTSTVNAITLTGLASLRAVLNVGVAALTLNPVAVLDAAALGAVRVAGVVEQTTIGTPALAFGSPGSPQPYAAIARRTPSILTSILNGRQEIANAIFPTPQRAQAVTATAQLSTASVATAAVTATATTTHKKASTTKATTSAKHAKK